jgi:branched-chain amino acid transport system substrate-binding protein
VKAVQFAAKQINDKGGILGGKMIETEVFDEGYSAETSVASAKKAIARGVKGIVGLQDVSTALPALTVVKDANIPIMIPTVGSQKVAEEGFYGSFHVWGPAPPDPAGKIPGIARWLEAQGYKRIIQVACDSGWCYNCDAEFRKVFSRPGSEVEYLGTIYFPYGAAQAEAEHTKAALQKPDFIYGCIWGHDVIVSSLSRLHELGYKGGRAVNVESLFPSDVKELGAAAEGVYVFERWRFDPSVPAAVEFRNAYMEVYGEEPESWVESAYEGAMALFLGMDKAGTDSDTKKIADAIHKLDWMTPRGEKLEIKPNGDWILRNYLVTQVKNGELVVVDRIRLE